MYYNKVAHVKAHLTRNGVHRN